MIPWLTGQQQVRQPIKYVTSGDEIKSSYISTPDLFNVKGNEVDCSVFAIAFAAELAFGESPEKKLLGSNSIRSHLSK